MKTRRKLTKKQKIYFEATGLFFISLLIFFFWNSFAVYPIKLLVIIFHEISHATAGIFTGHAVKSVQISSDLSGRTITAGGKNFSVIFSGYLGSIFWGALIFFISFKTKYLKPVSIAIGIILLLFTANVFKGALTAVAGLIFALIFILLPFLKFSNFRVYVYKFIGTASMFYVLVDIKEDLLTLSFKQTDAFLLSTITGIPPLVWGLFYFFLALGIFALLVYWSFKNAASN